MHQTNCHNRFSWTYWPNSTNWSIDLEWHCVLSNWRELWKILTRRGVNIVTMDTFRVHWVRRYQEISLLGKFSSGNFPFREIFPCYSKHNLDFSQPNVTKIVWDSVNKGWLYICMWCIEPIVIIGSVEPIDLIQPIDLIDHIETIDLIDQIIFVKSENSKRHPSVASDIKIYITKLCHCFFCVLESLDELSEMVTKLFSDVKNKNLEVPEWKDHPCGPDEVKVGVWFLLWHLKAALMPCPASS